MSTTAIYKTLAIGSAIMLVLAIISIVEAVVNQETESLKWQVATAIWIANAALALWPTRL